MAASVKVCGEVLSLPGCSHACTLPEGHEGIHIATCDGRGGVSWTPVPQEERDAQIRAMQQATKEAREAWEAEEKVKWEAKCAAREGMPISKTLKYGQMVYVWRGDHEGWGIIDDVDEWGQLTIAWCSPTGGRYGGNAAVQRRDVSTRRKPCGFPGCKWSDGHRYDGHLVGNLIVREAV